MAGIQITQKTMLAMIAESGSDAAAATAVGLSGTLLLIGTFLKNKTPINSEWIPLILIGLAVPSYIIMVWPVNFLGIVMAVGAAFSAVGMHSSAKSNPLKSKPPQS